MNTVEKVQRLTKKHYLMLSKMGVIDRNRLEACWVRGTASVDKSRLVDWDDNAVTTPAKNLTLHRSLMRFVWACIAIAWGLFTIMCVVHVSALDVSRAIKSAEVLSFLSAFGATFCFLMSRPAVFRRYIADLNALVSRFGSLEKFIRALSLNDGLKAFADTDLVNHAKCFLLQEELLGKGSDGSNATREGLKQVHNLYRRFDAADKTWDRYFKLAQEAIAKDRAANTIAL